MRRGGRTDADGERARKGAVFEWKVHETSFFTRKAVWVLKVPAVRAREGLPGRSRSPGAPGSCHLLGATARAGVGLQDNKRGPEGPESPAPGTLRRGGGQTQKRAGGQTQHLSDALFPTLQLPAAPEDFFRTAPHAIPPPDSQTAAAGGGVGVRQGSGWDPKYGLSPPG